MTTAREQARDKAVGDHRYMPPYDGKDLQAAADAASDVWEPLVRELYIGLKGWVDRYGHLTAHPATKAMLEGVREALGIEEP